MFILEFLQEDATKVGLFHDEKSILNFIASFPFLIKEEYMIEQQNFVEYFFNVSDIPEYLELSFNQQLFVMTNYMFDPSIERIDINWYELPVWTNTPQPILHHVDMTTRVDAYNLPNSEVKAYLNARNQLVAETKEYFSKKGKTIGRFLQGSQDGEVVAFSDGKNMQHILYNLDPLTIAERKQAPSFAAFIKKYLFK